jgi:hypothetical protein
VDYSRTKQLAHSSPDVFASQLRQVWQHVGRLCGSGAQLVIRFGGINERKADPLEVLRASLEGTGWHLNVVAPAGAASHGRRQAVHFARSRTKALEEHDVWATWHG